MKRINQIKTGSLVGANSGASDFRFCSGLNLFNLDVPLKLNNTVGRLAKPMEMRIAPSRQVHTVMSTLRNSSGHSAQSIRASSHQVDGSRQIGGFESPSRHLYEPLLGENRALGEILDSTTKENTRLI